VSGVNFDERVSRLAQYRPFDQDGAGIQTALRGLIFGAAAIGGPEFATLIECRDALRTLWDLDFDTDEIRLVADSLAEEGLCTRSRGGFVLADTVMDDLARAAQSAEANEAQAFAEWKDALNSLGVPLDANDFAHLYNDLHEWLGRIVSRHGVEAALLLYPEDPRAQQLMRSVDDLGLHFLPERTGSVGRIREEALRIFVRSPTEAQRIYLANRLDAAFELTVLTLDPDAIHLVQHQFTDHRVYLDTNFLYALIGYAPASESLAAHRLLTLTKDLGFKVAVTPWTVDELRTSLQASQNRITGMILPSRKYADLMIKAASEKGFDRAFWLSYRDSNISKRDFFDRAAHFEHDLEKLGVETVTDGCDKVEKKPETVQQYVVLLNHIRGPQWRETVVLEHDAKHRVLIEQLRGDGHHEFSSGRYWFLTQDTRLPLFARSMPNSEDAPPDLPFCMSSSAWAQIMRAFTPRTSDWESMVVDLLASPYVGWQRGLDFSAVTRVVGRIDQYSGDGVEFAWEVLADTATMAQVSALKSDGASDEEIASYIDGAFIEKAEEAQNRATKAEVLAREAVEREEAAQVAARTQQERASKLETDRNDERQRREGIESDLNRERRLRAEEVAEATAQSDKVTQQAEVATNIERQAREALEAAADKKRRTRRKAARIGSMSLLALVALASAVLLISTHEVHGESQTLFVILGAFVIALVSVNVGLGEKWAGRVFVYLGLLVGLAAIVVPLLFPSAH
jgi:hypothetical protein